MNLKFYGKFLSVLCILLINLSAVFANTDSIIHISENQLSVSELLKKIELQTDYMFVYNEANIDLNRVVIITKKDQTVSELLSSAFAKTDIRYEIEGKNIAFSKVQQDPVKKVTLKGKVIDTKGVPVIGAAIREGAGGVSADLEGNFSISVKPGAMLTVSAIGYETTVFTVGKQTNIEIVLPEAALTLDDVVVTAMGIKRKASSLTYSVQQLDGEDLALTKSTNLINSLSGKVAGVSITRGSGLGGSARVNIRGSRSAQAAGNNQPLYVIDGVPMLNSAVQTSSKGTALGGDGDAAGTDYGDGISNLNPDDIKSMSVLKGASAAALYGSQAANGVILITTKTGHSGSARVNFSSNLTVDNAFYLPEFQNTYGTGVADSWGAKGTANGKDNLDGYFSSGVTAINSISLSTGRDNSQSYFSYANTTAKGIIDNNRLSKHNFTVRQSANFFKDRLKLDANVNLLRQEASNPTSTGGYYLNPLVGLYRFPRGSEMSNYSGANMEKYDVARNLMVQNWYSDVNLGDTESNPYWLKDRTSIESVRNRVITSLSASLKITDWLDIQARGTVDYIGDRQETTMDASTTPTLTSNGDLPKYGNGRYRHFTSEQFMTYGDVMALVNKNWDNWSLNAVVGGSINVTTTNSLNIDSRIAGLINANLFQVANINKSSGALIEQQINETRNMQSVFATAQIGFKESLFLDIAVRNDWSSTLAFTNSMKSGFFYPSVGLSWVMNNSFKMPEWVNFAKIRGSFAQVGNDLPLYASTSYDTIDAIGGIIKADTFSENLKPEISSSYEVGFEAKFLDYAIDIDFTWYHTSTKNQLLRVAAPAGAPLGFQWINAGLITNQGFEITLGFNPFRRENFSWRSQFNFSTNQNKVVELYKDPTGDTTKDVTRFSYGDPGFGSVSYMMYVSEGGSLGDIYGKDFARDADGNIEHSEETGMPLIDGDFTLAGNSAPKALIGWSNTFDIYGIQLGFLIDARIGGKVMSFTQADLDFYGASKVTGDARDRGEHIEIEGKQYPVREYYQTVGGMKGASNHYVYDATNIRLRELTLGYSLPKKWMEKSRAFQDITVSFVARNLFFLYNEAPFDPEATMSAGNTLQGVDVFGMPTTRNLGFNIKLTF